MRAILITYDLNKPGQNYGDLYSTIKSVGAWWHYLDSTWIVQTRMTPQQVWEKLQPNADRNDSFLVIDITSDAYGGWLPQEAWDWLKKAV